MSSETLMASSQGFLCDLLGVKVYPTYSYARLYYAGNELVPHRDRPSCEFSVTVTLGGEFEMLWPIYIERADGEGLVCRLGIGDALVYKGCERTHWREPFEGLWQAQVFMHYVDADGTVCGMEV
jgi:alkylated DNA repair dioxygenase AlkB